MTLRDEALAAIPGYTEAKAAAANIAKYRQSAGGSDALNRTHHGIVAELQGLIRSGSPVPDDIGARLLHAEDAERAARLQRDAIRTAINSMDTNVDSTILFGIDEAYAFLDARLTELVDTATGHVSVLDGIRDSAEAMSGTPRQIAAWTALAPLVKDYNELRTVQVELYEKEAHTGPGHWLPFNTAGLYRDFIDVAPHFRTRRHEAAGSLGTAAANMQGSASTYREWLLDMPHADAGTDDTDGSYDWWGDGDRIARLAHIIRHTSPWVPTFKRLEDTFRAAGEATRAQQTATPPQLEARKLVYDITGLRTAHDLRVPDWKIRRLDNKNEVNIMTDHNFERKRALAQARSATKQADTQRREAAERARLG